MPPGALNQTSINFALRTRLWDRRHTEMAKKSLPKAKGPPVRATKEEIEQAEVGYEDINEKCAKLTEFGRIDRTTVREQAHRINQLLVIRKRRYENL